MAERILGRTTHQQIRTPDVVLQFALLILIVVCVNVEQAHDGSRALKKQIIPSSCDSQVCITNLLDATKMLPMMCRAKKDFWSHVLGVRATVGVNSVGLFHDKNAQHVEWQRDPNKNRNHTTCVARELAQRKHTVTVIFSNRHPQ